MLEIPQFLENRLRDGGEDANLKRWRCFTPQKYYLFAFGIHFY
jgi:hypothetical protein